MIPPAPTLPGCLKAWAASRPDAVALRDKDLGIWNPISWAEYYRQVSACGRMLWKLGVRPGEHVSILSENRPEWLYADLGAQGIGARAVGIYQTNPPTDVAYILDHSQSVVLFCEDQEQVDKAIACRDDTPSVKHVIVFDPKGTRNYDDDRLMRWDDFIERGLALLESEPEWFDEKVAGLDPEAASMVVYTSGTTGTPKGALLSPANALCGTEAMLPLLGASDKDVILSYLPLCHVAEKIFSLFLPMASGAVVHFGESIATVQEDLREVSPTVFLGVPRIWEKMNASITLRMADSTRLKRTLFDFFSTRGRAIRDPMRQTPPTLWERFLFGIGDLLVFRPLQERLGLRRCRLPVSGAAPISADLLRWFWGIGVPVLEGYGMTESAGVSHINPPGAVRIGSVGTGLSMLECVTAGDGEILVRGPNVFVGYLHNRQATAETVDTEGWLHTGDVGTLDDGYLTITGRKKEIIVTAGGKNLSPEKIENALKTSPFVKEAVAIGDRRKFVSALVQIDGEAVGDWATRRALPYTDFEDLSGKPEVRKLIESEINRANELLARAEQVREFRLFPKELHQDDGELTATQKVRRRAIFDIWGDLIDRIYT
jgi:long-chain acyl-CoA synthetase